MNRKTLLSAAAGLLGGLLVGGILWATLHSAASAPRPVQAPERIARELALTAIVVRHLEQQMVLAVAEFAALGPGYSAEHKQAARLIIQFGAELSEARDYALELGTRFQLIRSEPNGGGWAARRVP